MVVRRNDTSRTKHLSNNRMPSETYLEDEEGAKLLVLTDWLKNDVGALFVQIKKLETTVECIENYVEEKTGVEPGKRFHPIQIHPNQIMNMSHSKRLPAQKRIFAKLTFAVPKVQVMESKRQAERVPEGPSEKDLSNNLPSDPEELTKVFEKNLKRLENLVKLFKSDVSKMFDISDPISQDQLTL
ncbi:unnamed protein product [Rhizophagus irregularis]|nr:unnamed protein product [Rhizophagus irregularis]